MMKKNLLIVLAILLTCGIANATNIPEAVDPQYAPTVWTETVYNGSGSTIQSATIVQWDFDTCDISENWFDDMCPYVKTADAADDVWTAGVTIYGQTIANGSTGQIIIRGATVVLDNANTVTANTFVSTDASGRVKDEACDAVDETMLGIAIKNTHPVLGDNHSIIYVCPTPYENGT